MPKKNSILKQPRVKILSSVLRQTLKDRKFEKNKCIIIFYYQELDMFI